MNCEAIVQCHHHRAIQRGQISFLNNILAILLQYKISIFPSFHKSPNFFILLCEESYHLPNSVQGALKVLGLYCFRFIIWDDALRSIELIYGVLLSCSYPLIHQFFVPECSSVQDG